MDIKEKRKHILELCSESEVGSWEFWSGQDKTEVERDQIFQAIMNLVREKKIYPIEYATIADRSYKEASLDAVRLKDELNRSMKSHNVDPRSFYWFLATDEGKDEDLDLRKR